MLYCGSKTALTGNNDELREMLSHGWSKDPPAAMEVNLGDELSPAMLAEAQAIDARLREPFTKDLLRKVEALEARLTSALGGRSDRGAETQ